MRLDLPRLNLPTAATMYSARRSATGRSPSRARASPATSPAASSRTPAMSRGSRGVRRAPCCSAAGIAVLPGDDLLHAQELRLGPIAGPEGLRDVLVLRRIVSRTGDDDLVTCLLERAAVLDRRDAHSTQRTHDPVVAPARRRALAVSPRAAIPEAAEPPGDAPPQ